MTIGFFLLTRLATSAKARPSLRSSQCWAMMWVSSSCSKKVSRSSSSMSDLLPRPTMAETPILAEREKPMIAMPMPPDCDERAAWPLYVVGGAERRAEVLRRIVEAVDVRAHEADAVFAADLLDLELAVFVAGLGEAGRDQHGAGDLLLAALGQRGGDELGGDGEDGGVDRVGDVFDRLIGLVAEDLVGLGVDREDLALVAAVDEVLHHRVADLAVLGTRRRSPRSRRGA